MIIPIRCFTCGKVLADKWNYYQNTVNQRKKNDPNFSEKNTIIADSNINHIEKTIDELGLTRLCCRRHMLTHVDLTN